MTLRGPGWTAGMPLTTEHTPPGALSKALLPAVAVALAMSLTEPAERRPAPQG